MGGFNDSVLGGVGSLIRSWIQSVPFVSGSTGWRISKDGTAQFNSVTIRGGVVVTNGSQIFVYSSNPPATGTLVFSISPTGGTDPYGNTYNPGFVNYGGSTIGIVNGNFSIVTPFGDILELQWDTINFVLSLNDAIPLNFVVSQLMAHLGVDGFNISAGSIKAVKPGTGTTFLNPATGESWHILALGAGWQAQAANIFELRYKLTAEGEVHLNGSIITNSATPNAVFATMPANYFSATKGSRFPATLRTNTGTVTPTVVDLGTGGALTTLINPTATLVSLHIDVQYPLA